MHRFNGALAALVCSVFTLSGCELYDLVSKDQPNKVQKQAIGDIIAHAIQVGAVLDDPAAADDGDLRDLFQVTPYIDLIAPDTAGTEVGASARVIAAAATSDPDCIVLGESSMTMDCQVPWDGAMCQVTGTGSRTGSAYTGAFHTSGTTCGTLDVTVELTLEGTTSASGTLQLAGQGAEPFDLSLSLDAVTFCPDGLPNGGSLIVDGTGTVGGRAFDDSVQVDFGPDCGLALLP